MSTFTCLTAPGVEFETKELFGPHIVFLEAWSAHYKSEWHRYNLRRKTAGLSMVSEAEFETRRAAAEAGSSSGGGGKQQAHVKASKRERHQQVCRLPGI